MFWQKAAWRTKQKIPKQHVWTQPECKQIIYNRPTRNNYSYYTFISQIHIEARIQPGLFNKHTQWEEFLLHNGRVNDLPKVCRIIYYINPSFLPALHHSRSASFRVRVQYHDCFDQGHIMNHKVLPSVCESRVERTQAAIKVAQDADSLKTVMLES